MEEILNNFYGKWIIFIIAIVFVGLAIVDTIKKKYNIDIKNKLDTKNIDFKYLLEIIFLSLGLRIIIEQIISLFSLAETIIAIPTGIIQIIIQFIATCIFAPIFEEIIFRFGIYEHLNKKIKCNICNMIIISIVFALTHFYGIDGMIILIVISFIWNYSYFKTNNLLYPIILHSIHNIYALIGSYIINTYFYILLALICLMGYIILLLKSSSKNTTAN